MTLGECFIKTRKLINYYSASGSVITSADPTRKDCRYRSCAAVDEAQWELSRRCPMLNHISVAQHALRPRACMPGTFMLDGSRAIDAPGAKAFSFETDGTVTAELEIMDEGVWRQLLHKEASGAALMYILSAEYDGDVPESAQARLNLTGKGVFIRDAALYAGFPPGEDAPLYGARRYHHMPEDFGRVVKAECAKRLHTGFYDVTDGKLGLPFNFHGTVEITYTVHPVSVADGAEESVVLALPDEAAELVPYYAAAILLSDENPELSEKFMDIYRRRKPELSQAGQNVSQQLFGGVRRGV